VNDTVNSTSKHSVNKPRGHESLFSSRWFRVLFVTLILSLGILVGTPVLIERLAERWLEQHGGDRVEVQDVDFNPFTGILRLDNVSVQVQDRTPLSFNTAELNLAWLPLFSKHIQVQSIELTGFRMVVRNEDVLRIGGIQLPAGEQDTATDKPADESTHWAAGIHALGLHDFTLLYHDRNIHSTVYIDSLQLNELAQWTPEQPARLDFKGSINDAPVTLEAALAPFSATPVYKGSLAIKELKLSDFESLTQPALKKLAGMASLKGDFSIEQDNQTLHVQHNGTLSVSEIEVYHQSARVANQASSWAGVTDLTLATSKSKLQLQNQGKLNIGKLSVDLIANKLKVLHDNLALDGTFKFSDTESGQDINLLADIDISKPNLEAPEKEMDLVGADRLRIKGLELDKLQQFKAEKITVDALNIGRRIASPQSTDKDEAFYRAGQLLVSDINYADGFTSIDTIHEDDVHVLYQRDEAGNWEVNTLLGVLLGEEKEPEASANGTAVEKAAEPTETADSQTVKNRLAINRIDISDGSTMTILDKAVSPAFRDTLTFSELSLEKLDTGKPGQASALRLESKLGKHTTLSASGDVRPFQQPLGLDLEGKLYAMDLPRLSPYARDSLGVLLDSGTLDVDLKIKSENNVMDGKAVLKLHQLELESVDSTDGLQSKIPVPLNVALDTLRDRNNTIELDIPIEGDANNPDFDVSDAISQAFATGLKKGAVSYLKYALQPYGTLILAAEYAGEAVTRVRLKSIEFEPGQSDMDDSDRDYLAKVAQVLHDRPKLAIKLCGVAVKQDALYFQQLANAERKKNTGKETTPVEPVIDEQKLTELARQRAAQVKNYLVEKFKVPADHLVGCRARIETDKADASARTDLLI
jgi:outer membrane protein OmpA-like peptidoglycan-associated protein